MIVNDILQTWLDLTNTTVDDVTVVQQLRYANLTYHDLENSIINDVREDYFWDIITENTEVNKSEYTLPDLDTSNTWVNRIQRVELKYKSTDTYHTKLRPWTIRNYLNNSTEYVESEISSLDWQYEVKEWSLLVYPAPSEAITWGLKVHVIKTLIDLVSWWAETTVFPNQSKLKHYHILIAIGMKKYIYRQLQKFNEADNAEAEYEREKKKMIDYLNGRITEPLYWENPDGSSLMI